MGSGIICGVWVSERRRYFAPFRRRRRARINVDGVAYRRRALCSDATGRGVSVKDDERPGVDIAERGSPESYSMLSMGCGDASVEFGACSRDGGDLYSPD